MKITISKSCFIISSVEFCASDEELLISSSVCPWNSFVFAMIEGNTLRNFGELKTWKQSDYQCNQGRDQSNLQNSNIFDQRIHLCCLGIGFFWMLSLSEEMWVLWGIFHSFIKFSMNRVLFWRREESSNTSLRNQMKSKKKKILLNDKKRL